MKAISTLALLAIVLGCSDASRMLRSASNKDVKFSLLSTAGSSDGSLKHKPHDGSWDGTKGGRPPHPPHHPQGSWDGSFDGSMAEHFGGRDHHGHGKPPGSLDGSFFGHGKPPGSFDGSFDGKFPDHGKWHDGSFHGHGKKGKKIEDVGSGDETQQETTKQQTSGSD